jgi:dephospho-CoA kinase
MKIVITGNIASGKTTLIQWIKENPTDSCVIDADDVVHQLYKTVDLQSKLKKEFGPLVISEHNEVDRQFLGKLVFKDKAQLEKLNQITQEPIRKALELQINELYKTHALVFIEATLAVERSWLSFFDYSICVVCPDNTRLKRLMIRNSLSKEEANLRIDSQMSQTLKSSHCDFTLNNESSQEELIKDFQKVLQQIKV